MYIPDSLIFITISHVLMCLTDLYVFSGAKQCKGKLCEIYKLTKLYIPTKIPPDMNFPSYSLLIILDYIKSLILLKFYINSLFYD